MAPRRRGVSGAPARSTAISSDRGGIGPDAAGSIGVRSGGAVHSTGGGVNKRALPPRTTRRRAARATARAAARILGVLAMSHDTLIHRIVRPAVRAVAGTRVTPNHITTLRLITGAAAALAFARGGAFWPAVGGAVFLLSMLLDRADGELARQTGRSSPGGHTYDLVSDCSANAIAFLGIGVGQAAVLGPIGPLLGLLAGAGIGAMFWQIHVLKRVEVRGGRFWDGRVVVDPDDAMALVPVFVWCGAEVPVLAAAAAITPVGALWLGRGGSAPPGRKG